MKPNTRFSIFLIALFGLSFLIFSSVKWQYWGLKHLLLAMILFAFGFMSFILYFLAKDWQKILTKIMFLSFSLSLILSLYLSYEYYEWNRYQKTLNEYDKIETCNGLKERFEKDLEKNDLKYFDYGMVGDIELRKELRNKYDIESFGMGCLVDMKEECYNKLVNEYLIEKYNDSIIN